MAEHPDAAAGEPDPAAERSDDTIGADASPGSADMPEGSDAPAEALARARALARAKGLRPGSAPRRAARPAGGGRGASRDPALLSEVVERLVSDRGWEHEVEVGSVIGRWPSIVGPDLAEHARPETFEDGVLVVRASSTSWATQLRLLSSTLLARIEQETGPDVVRELRVIGPSAPSWRHGRRGITGGRGPRDTYG